MHAELSNFVIAGTRTTSLAPFLGTAQHDPLPFGASVPGEGTDQ
jgi:hypothetical protein